MEGQKKSHIWRLLHYLRKPLMKWKAARRRESRPIMADLMCSMDCKHRSKRPLRKWQKKDGRPCYGCRLKYVNISRVFDLDGDICAVAGEENMAHCAFYEPLNEPEV